MILSHEIKIPICPPETLKADGGCCFFLKREIYIYTCIHITWNPTDPCFEWKGPSFGGFKPQNRGQTGSRYILYTWNLKHPFINGCFNWMIPNHYIKNACFTKHPFKTGCLGFQVCIYIYIQSSPFQFQVNPLWLFDEEYLPPTFGGLTDGFCVEMFNQRMTR